MLKFGALVSWLIGLGLALRHLVVLSGKQQPHEFWRFTCVLLIFYSIPFVLMLSLSIPGTPSRARIITKSLFVVICSVSLLVPSRRFFPGYQPEALESLVYIFVPLIQCFLIAAYGIFRWASVLARWKGRRIDLPGGH
jgi:hypothetical protein